MITILNPPDECALLMALEQKDLDHKVEVSLVALNTEDDSSDFLKRALSLGADSGILLGNGREREMNLNSDAYFWSRALTRLDWRIVMVGMNKIDTQEDEFGVYLGEYLNLPIVSGVIGLEALSDKKVRCWRKLEKGNREVIECDLPALLSVEQTNRVRYPTLKRIARSQGYQIAKLCQEKGWEKSIEGKIVFQKYQSPRARVKKGLVEMDSNLSVSERLAQLFSGGRSEKKNGHSDELRGPPQELAQKVLEYLIQWRVI